MITMDTYRHFFCVFDRPLKPDGDYFCSGKMTLGSNWGPWVMRLILDSTGTQCQMELSYFDWSNETTGWPKVVRDFKAFEVDPSGVPFSVTFGTESALWNQGMRFVVQAKVTDRLRGYFAMVRE